MLAQNTKVDFLCGVESFSFSEAEEPEGMRLHQSHFVMGNPGHNGYSFVVCLWIESFSDQGDAWTRAFDRPSADGGEKRFGLVTFYVVVCRTIPKYSQPWAAGLQVLPFPRWVPAAN